MANESLSSVIRRKLGSKAILLAGLLLLLLFSANFIRSRSSNRTINREISSLETEVSQLEQGNSQLAELIKYLNSPAYLEEKARTDLGLRKAGERAVIVPDTGASSTAETASASTLTTFSATSNPGRWWRYFFAKK